MREKLETLSVSVLKEFAKDKNIKNISAMRKSELIDAILAANNEEEQTHSLNTMMRFLIYAENMMSL